MSATTFTLGPTSNTISAADGAILTVPEDINSPMVLAGLHGSDLSPPLQKGKNIEFQTTESADRDIGSHSVCCRKESPADDSKIGP